MTIRYIVHDIEANKFLNIALTNVLVDKPSEATFFDSLNEAVDAAREFAIYYAEIKTIYKI